MELLAFVVVVSLVISLTIGSVRGYFRGKAKIRQDDKQIKATNPYQYYKELPNDYGVGVVSLLTNSQIENEKDIIAAILDLCAQKYLYLSKHSDHYVIRLLPNPPKTPLSNEAYLLDLIKNHRLQEIDYRTWYNYCVADGVQLGLYYPTKLEDIKFDQPKIRPRKSLIVLKIGVVLLAVSFLPALVAVISMMCFQQTYHDVTPLLEFAKTCAGCGIFVIILSLPIMYFSMLFSSLKSASKNISRDYYKWVLEKHLTRTPKGVQELQKLHAFRNFLDQFHTFVDQNPEAVVIWSRYLSYAQVFGIADKIMKTGYTELISNADFKIDDINNISLSNIS